MDDGINICCFYQVFLHSESKSEFSNGMFMYLFQKLLDRFDYDDEPEAMEESKKEDAAATAATTTSAVVIVPPAPAATAAAAVTPATSPPQAPL